MTEDQDAPSPVVTYTADRLIELSERAESHLEKIRQLSFDPDHEKILRKFSKGEVCKMLNIARETLRRRIKEGIFPEGELNQAQNARHYDLGTLHQMMEIEGVRPSRGNSPRAARVAITNYKGGVGKTSITLNVAQYFGMLGYRVLIVDSDPQGSSTEYHGIIPDAELEISDTLAQFYVEGDPATLASAIRTTHWSGVDLLPANSALSHAEIRLYEQEDFGFFAHLDRGLAAVEDHYDIIFIDTPPSLGFLTANAVYASDGLVVPIPPEALDYASSVQYFATLGAMCNQFPKIVGRTKTFDFVRILCSRFRTNNNAHQFWLRRIRSSYSDITMEAVFKETRAVQIGGTQLQTIGEIPPSAPIDAGARRDAQQMLAQVGDEILRNIQQVWLRLEQGGGASAATAVASATAGVEE
ncbi:hypothetical protein CKO15_12695 [Halorhodospira abdelmalekii]|uniref:AAA family ATPase n=1 Tax=Halorhodospira abdelmalekii TaxID=421629 RepID=UPI001906EA4F|nr:AAA family ATPase [Halorhodospira abdelmalekii]MBK1736112.1 hypothetical protein [Halorhodospira abdelmalekii]